MYGLPHRRTSLTLVLFSVIALAVALFLGWLLVAVLAGLNAALWMTLWMLRRREVKQRHLWPTRAPRRAGASR
jgi:hypothetical protein